MWTLNELLEGCEGEHQGQLSHEKKFNAFSIDTRTIQKNMLFIALSGPNFDGHQFVERAIQKGSSGAVVSKNAFAQHKTKWLAHTPPYFFVQVDDTLQSLQNLAKWHRKRFSIPVVGITGSNGKTSTKEMLATILQCQGAVLKTEGNLNNHIGLPLTLLRLGSSDQQAVVEMGISQKEEMKTLCEIARPTIGLITNIGPAHLEGLQNLKGVAKEKGILFETLGKCDTAIINRDDPFLQGWKNRVNNAWTFGLTPESASADLTADNIHAESGHSTFTLHQNRSGEKIEVRLPVPGRHQVSNALAAAAVACSLNIPLVKIAKGLSRFKALAQRTEIIETKGLTVLFDAYNANPASVEAALDLLAARPQPQGTRIALLGEMLELGDFSDEGHFKIGEMVARRKIQQLIAVGKSATIIAEGARAAGMSPGAISIHPNLNDIEATLKSLLHQEHTLLIKGSRGMKLEQVLPYLGIGEKN